MFQKLTQIVKKSHSLNCSKWRRTMTLHYSKKLSALLTEITSKHHGDCYCLNFVHSFSTRKQM